MAKCNGLKYSINCFHIKPKLKLALFPTVNSDSHIEYTTMKKAACIIIVPVDAYFISFYFISTQGL